MALASNRSLAEQNLDVKPRLEAQKEVLVEKYSQLEATREAYRQHCSIRGWCLTFKQKLLNVLLFMQIFYLSCLG